MENFDGSWHGSISANTVKHLIPSSGASTFRVFNRDSTRDLYLRVDGIDPTVAGQGTHVVLPETNRDFNTADPPNASIKLIAGYAVQISVEVV